MVSRRSGFTLLETLVALALTSALLLPLGAMTITMARTARDTEVNLVVQRDIVSVMEAAQAHLRVAAWWEELSTPQPPVTDLRRGYSIYGVSYDPDPDERVVHLVDIQLTNTNELYVGNRKVSSRISEFVLSDTDLTHMASVYVKSVDSIAGVSYQHLPISLNLSVAMRNSPLHGASAELPAFIGSPTATPYTTTALVTFGTTVPVRGYIDYWRHNHSESNARRFYISEYGTLHTHILGGAPYEPLAKNTRYHYRVVVQDRYGRTLRQEPHGVFQTDNK